MSSCFCLLVNFSDAGMDTAASFPIYLKMLREKTGGQPFSLFIRARNWAPAENSYFSFHMSSDKACKGLEIFRSTAFEMVSQGRKSDSIPSPSEKSVYRIR